MAYTLKSTGIATNLLYCVAADEDDTIKDFVAGGLKTRWVDASDTATTGTVGTATWGAGSRKYWNIDSSHFLKFRNNADSADATLALPFGGNRTVFIAFADTTRTAAGNDFILSPDGVYGARASEYEQRWWLRIEGSNACYTGDFESVSSTNYVTTGNHSVAWASTSSSSRTAYVDGAESVGPSPSSQNAPVTVACSYFGRGSSASAANIISGKFFCLAVFDTTLNSTQVAALNTDWFSELFESGASAVVNKLRGPFGGPLHRLI